MVFLGLEKPVDYGRQLIFDPSTALMVLEALRLYANAVYNDYQLGILEMKDFNKEFGTFQTPILEDQEWWNLNVTDPVRKLISEAYANGVDLLRSPLGRAMISQLIINRPYGDMALVRQSAENAKELIKAQGELEAKGLYDPSYAKYDYPDLSSYSTVGKNGLGVFLRRSPTPMHDMATFGNPYFEGMKPNIHSESKNGVSYSVEEIAYDDLRRVADAHHNELVSTPQGLIMYKYYQDIARKNGSQDVEGDARRMFNDAVADGQLRRIYRNDDYNDQWAKREQIKQGWAKIALDKEQFEWLKFTDMAQLGLLGDETPTEDLSYTTQMEANSIAKYNKAAGINSPADYAQTTFDISKYWENKALQEKDPKKKKYAEQMLDFWFRASKDGLELAEKKGILKRDSKTGELIPSKVYSKEIGLAYGAKSTGRTSVSEARKLADVYYNRFISTAGGTEYDKTSADLLAGGSGELKSFPGGSATNKYRTVQLDDKDVYYTPMRRMLVAGYNVHDLESAPLIKEFNDWLKGSPRLGYMVNSNTTRASLPTTNGGRTREISGYARIPATEFDEFVKQYKKNHPSVDSQTIYDGLGLSFFKMQSSTPINGKKQWVDAQVVEIPITRVRINSNSLEDSAWNTHHDENTGGKAKAEGKIISRQKESLNKR